MYGGIYVWCALRERKKQYWINIDRHHHKNGIEAFADFLCFSLSLFLFLCRQLCWFILLRHWNENGFLLNPIKANFDFPIRSNGTFPLCRVQVARWRDRRSNCVCVCAAIRIYCERLWKLGLYSKVFLPNKTLSCDWVSNQNDWFVERDHGNRFRCSDRSRCILNGIHADCMEWALEVEMHNMLTLIYYGNTYTHWKFQLIQHTHSCFPQWHSTCTHTHTQSNLI